jgi:hypothetical protein
MSSLHRIAFISGPLESDDTYFKQYYISRIDDAIAEGCHFLLGPSRGIDSQSLSYLLSKNVSPSRITIHLFIGEATKLKSRFTSFEKKGGKVVVRGISHTERDEWMTKGIHFDILRYRTEEEQRLLYGETYRRRVSGTEKNEIRRKTGIGMTWTGLEEASEVTVKVDQDIVLDSTRKSLVVSGATAEDANKHGVQLTPAQKRIKGLSKKIREAKSLQKRVQAGEILEANQLQKIENIEQWEHELSKLDTQISIDK